MFTPAVVCSACFRHVVCSALVVVLAGGRAVPLAILLLTCEKMGAFCRTQLQYRVHLLSLRWLHTSFSWTQLKLLSPPLLDPGIAPLPFHCSGFGIHVRVCIGTLLFGNALPSKGEFEVEF